MFALELLLLCSVYNEVGLVVVGSARKLILGRW